MHSVRPMLGFTLIELMIVVAIVAILAAIAIPAYQDYTIRSQVSEAFTVGTRAKTAVWDYYADTGRLPTGNTAAGLPAGTQLGGGYVSAVEIQASGTVRVSFGGPRANAAIGSGAYLELVPVLGANGLEWSCQRGSLPPRFVPSVCR